MHSALDYNCVYCFRKYFEIGREPIVFVCTEAGNSKILQALFPQNIREKFDIDLIK